MAEATKKVNLRQQMPQTAQWVDERREAWGAEWVNGCIRRAQQGEPGLFYAIEAGHVLGTPFPATHPVADLQLQAVMLGSAFAGFMAEPGQPDVEGAADGSH